MTHLYVMQAESGPVKIGFSKQPEARVQSIVRYPREGVEGEVSLRHQVLIPDDLDPYKVEHTAHVLAADRRLKGEWFDMTPDEALTAIRKAIALRGVSPRPPLVKKLFSLPEGISTAIEDYRFEERIATEAEAVRQLLMAGLEAKGRKIGAPAKDAKK